MRSTALSQVALAVPDEKTVVDVVGVEDGRVATSIVEELSGDEIVLTRPLDRQQPLNPEPGTRLELIWKDAEGLLALPVTVMAREQAGAAVLRVRRAGPAAPGQRRSAVRAPLVLPIQLSSGPQQLPGRTVDISEGGLRCVLDAADRSATDPDERPGSTPSGPLAVGHRATLVIAFATAVVDSGAEVVRRHVREDGRRELSLRFVGMPEFTRDLIRRQVFAGLRDLRLRGLI